MAAGNQWRLGRRPALDGVRGVAVLLVLIGHAIPFPWGGPETGVTLFFVLSGFLITALLLEERRDRGGIDLLAFYRRRALRLFPALALLLTVVFALSELSIPNDTSDKPPAATDNQLSALFYYANWRIIVDRMHNLGVLNHTWSLSIEEQFYFVWPLFLVGAVAWLGLRSRRLLALVATLALVSGVEGWLLYWSSSGREGGRVYFGTDTRADALLLGAVLAIWLVSGRRLRVPATFFGFGICLVAISVYSSSRELEKVPILATLGAAIVIAGLLHRPRTSALLAWAPLRWTGRISYGLYLWHYPLFAIMLPHLAAQPRLVRLVAACAAAYAAAAGSYYLFERHFLRLKRRSSRVQDFAPAVVKA